MTADPAPEDPPAPARSRRRSGAAAAAGGAVARSRASAALLGRRLGTPVDVELLQRALTHRSFAYENGGLPTNERLEFLGDSVLGLVVTDRLYTANPDLSEGQLAKLRAAVVNMRALAEVARGLRLGDFLHLGRGEETTGGRDKPSILADTLEAVIGAVYVSGGLDPARELVLRLFSDLISGASALGAGLDWKTSLQELTAAAGLGVPAYAVTERGPDHAKTFSAAVEVAGEVVGRGGGGSKKEAEQRAAEAGWTLLTARAAAEGIGAGPDAAPGVGPSADPA